MATELSWSDNGNVATTSIPWTSVQRTSTTATIVRRLWNELVTTGTASTATKVMLRPVYQMNAGEPFLGSGVQPADDHWLKISQSSTIQNPLGLTGPDYQGFSLGEFGVGAGAPFLVRGNIPRKMAREFNLRLAAETTGTATSINAMQITASADSGTVSLGPHSAQRGGDGIVFPGDWSQYRLLRARDGDGIKVTEDAPAASLDGVIVEPATFQLGVNGIGETIRFNHTIPAIGNAADGATVAGESYVISLYKNPSGFRNGASDFTFQKGNKAATGSETPPAAPSLDHVLVAHITKTHLANITNALIDDSVAIHGAGTVTFDGTGLDCGIGSWLEMVQGLANHDDAERAVTGLANNSTLYAKVDGLGVHTVDATVPTSGENLLAVVTTSAGNTTSVSNRQLYHANGSYRARRRVEVSPWVTPDLSDSLQFFGRLDSEVAGTVDGTPTSQTVSFAGGHRIAARITTFTTYGTLRVTGTSMDGSGTEVAAATEDLIVTANSQWVMTDKRWFGTGANSPDVVLSSVGGLDVALAAYRCEPWDNHGRPTHLAALKCEFVPISDLAELRVRLYKVGPTGAATTVFDSSAKTGLSGSGAGIGGVPCQLMMDETGGTNTDTEMLYAVPDNAILDPWFGEWMYVDVTGIVDIESMRMLLYYYELMA